MSEQKTQEIYIQELIEEIEILDPIKSKYTIKLLGEELSRIRNKALKKELKAKQKREELVKLTRKIVVPTEKYPCYNFVGKLMGPKATNIKRIQSETKSSVLILGQGSTRDKAKEMLLAQSGEPKFAHFKEPLHISIHVKGFKKDAEARLAAAVAEVEKYMDPNNEQVKFETQRTLTMLTTPNAYGVNGVAPIIRVGVPPPGAILLSGSKGTGSSYKPRTEGYTYDASFDGTYEGYPSTAPAPTTPNVSDALVLEPFKESAPPTPRSCTKRPLVLSPSSSSSEGSRSPEPRPILKKPAMTVSNMFCNNDDDSQ